MKWKYFAYTWKDASTWKDATNPETWLLGGRLALDEIWKEYKDLPIDDDIPTSGSKRARSLDTFEKSFNMALLYDDEDDEDALVKWLSTKLYMLLEEETLRQF